MGKRFWKPIFRVVPGTEGQIWYIIQYRGGGGAEELLPCYRFFRWSQLMWFKKKRWNFSDKHHAALTVRYSTCFYIYYGWYHSNYRKSRTSREYEECSYIEASSRWPFSVAHVNAIVNFLSDRGYAYAKRGIASSVLYRGRSKGAVSRLKSTLYELANSGCGID